MHIVLILDHKETEAFGKSAENISAPLSSRRLEKFQAHFHKVFKSFKLKVCHSFATTYA